MLWYCGFDAFLQFRSEESTTNNNEQPNKSVYLHPLNDLILNRNNQDNDDKIINAFIGWCSLFLQTGKGKIIFLGYSKQKRQNSITTCVNVPKYIIQIECGSKETFLVTLDSNVYKWSGFNFEKSSPELIQFTSKTTCNNNNNTTNNNGETQSENHDEIIKINVEQICIGAEYSCVLNDEHEVYTFDPNELCINEKISNDNDFIVSISVGQEHILMLADNGSIYSYGNGSRGQLGHGIVSNTVEKQAKIVEALEGIRCKAIAAGGWHSMALSETGDVYVWGWNESGQLGFGRETIKIEATPTLLDISEDDSFMSIAAGSRHSMAVSQNGLLFGWGWNKYGQLGMNPSEIEFADTPHVIPFDHKVSSVTCKFWSSLIETNNDEDD